MKKTKVAVIFGGKSGEHEVSIVSATNVVAALDPAKYEVTLIGIDKEGRWLLPDQTLLLAHSANPRLVKLSQEQKTVSLVPFQNSQQLVPLDGKGEGRVFDVVFPVLHGTYGEDGTIQGLLELAQIPYVGSGVLGSSVGMDKDVARRLMAAAGIPVVPTKVIRKHEFEASPQRWADVLVKEFGLPFFVKPANMGSSVGVHKIKSASEVESLLRDAFRYDIKVLVEKAVAARELECAVLGHHQPKASVVGEIVPQAEFYSYEAKYIDEDGALLKIPCDPCPEGVIPRLQELAIRAFQALELRGMARVDFFLDRQTDELYLNEVNTIPGFTQISMYPKLWQASGLSYSQLLDELIRLALEAHAEKKSLLTSYQD